MKGDLRTALKGKLSPAEVALIYKSYDVIGDIAVIRVPEPLSSHSKTIAEALMQQHKHVKAVWRQSSPVSGEFRLRELELVAGERKTETVHREHGCLFKVDVNEVYFSPRLGFERMRIARLVRVNEIVVNMFAGAGCYSIVIAKHSKAAKIYSIDLNPIAVKYMRENVLLNKMVDEVLPMEGDAKTVIQSTLKSLADRVVMPLPERAYEYLDSAVLALKPKGGWIHYYDFEHARKGESPIEKVKTKVAEKLKLQGRRFDFSSSRIVRQTGPNWHQIAVDIQMKNLEET